MLEALKSIERKLVLFFPTGRPFCFHVVFLNAPLFYTLQTFREHPCKNILLISSIPLSWAIMTGEFPYRICASPSGCAFFSARRTSSPPFVNHPPQPPPSPSFFTTTIKRPTRATRHRVHALECDKESSDASFTRPRFETDLPG